MKIYIDNCVIQRPLDDQTQIRIATESEAILGILQLWEIGEIEIIGSEALELEISKIPQLEKLTFSNEILNRMSEIVIVSDEVEKRAREFVDKYNLKAFDALHLACAEEAKVDYLCTCDDKFIKKARRVENLKTTILSPLELVIKF